MTFRKGISYGCECDVSHVMESACLIMAVCRSVRRSRLGVISLLDLPLAAAEEEEESEPSQIDAF